MKSLLAIILFFTIFSLNSQTVLSPGDIVVFGFKTAGNANGNRDCVKLLFLKNVECGTQFIVTDLNWDATNNQFRTCTGSDQEFGIEVTVTQEIIAGSVLKIDVDDPPRPTPLLISGAGTATDTDLEGVWGTNYGLTSGGDNIFILQGTFASPSFIFGLRNNGTFASGGNCANKSNTGLPASLTLGQTAVEGVGANRWHYNCSVLNSGTTIAIRNSIATAANWHDISNANWDGGANYNVNCVFDITDADFGVPTGSIGISGAGCGCLSGCNLTSLGGPNCSPAVTGNCTAGYQNMSVDVDVPDGCVYTVMATMRRWGSCTASGGDGNCATCDYVKVDIPGGPKPVQTGASDATINDSYTLTGPGTIRVSGRANRADEIVVYRILSHPCDICGVFILPVELLEFSANYEKENESVILEWVTGSEINNHYFLIEKSEDGQNFDDLVMVYGNGNSSNQQYYKIYDTSPYSGISYYRLKQVDYDGKFSYSRIVSVEKVTKNLKIVKLTNILGQEVDENYTGLIIILYEDGTCQKIIR